MRRMWPPRWSYLPAIAAPLLETIHIATLGTAIAIAFALPIAFLAARNTTLNGFTWAVGRALLVASRSVNTVIWGLVFVAIFGPGALAGVAAVAARSVGFLAKLIAEAIEEADAGQVEAIRATGAGTAQVYLIGILPQVIPVVLGTTVYRWDINIRESSVLGFVGAGGIGLQPVRLDQPVRLAAGAGGPGGDPRHRVAERGGLRLRSVAESLDGRVFPALATRI